jgi:acyl carrier protein
MNDTSTTVDSEIGEAVKSFILTEFLPGENPSELGEDTPLITGKILDSIAALKLVGFLEARFGFEVEAHEADFDNLDSIGRIVRFVHSKLRPTHG